MIDRLNESITVQALTVTADRYGNHKQTWTDTFTCHAYADTYQALQKAAEEANGQAVTHDGGAITFEVRWCSELGGITTTGHRVLFHGTPYDIVAIDMMNFGRHKMRLSCRRPDR